MKAFVARRRAWLALCLVALAALYTYIVLDNSVLGGPTVSDPPVSPHPRSNHSTPHRTSERTAPRWHPPPEDAVTHDTLWLHQFDDALSLPALADAIRERKRAYSLTTRGASSSPPHAAAAAAASEDVRCITQLSPSLQLACRHLQRHNLEAYAASWCPALQRCVMWGEGTFSPPITEALLRARHAAVANAAPRWMRLGLLVTTPQDLEAYRTTATARAALQAQDISAQEICLSAVGSGRRCDSLQDLNVPIQVVFPACGSSNVACAVQEHPVLSPVQQAAAGLRLDGVSVLSVLFYLSRRSARPGQCGLLVFSGDSTLRETFLRLIHLIRFDHHDDDHDISSSLSPFFDLPTWGDIVYSVFEDGDTFELFASPFSGGGSRKHNSDDLRRFLDQSSSSSPPGGRRPILMMLFLFSKRTSEPRRELWDANHLERRLDHVASVGLVVEGTLFWEGERDRSFVDAWRRESMRTVTSSSYPLVIMTAHPKFELCRAGHHALVPKRILGLPAAPPFGSSPLPLVFNSIKNAESLEFMAQVLLQRSRSGVMPKPANAPLWKDVFVLDKAALTWLPGVLPIDHIHLSCRMVPSLNKPQDPLLVRPIRTVDQWWSVLHSGDDRNQRHRISEEDAARWADVVEGLDGALSPLLPPIGTPLPHRWRHAGGKKRTFGRYVNLATDGRRGCADVGNHLLIHELIVGLL